MYTNEVSRWYFGSVWTGGIECLSETSKLRTQVTSWPTCIFQSPQHRDCVEVRVVCERLQEEKTEARVQGSAAK